MHSWQSAHVPTDVSCIFQLCYQHLLCCWCHCLLLCHRALKDITYWITEGTLLYIFGFVPATLCASQAICCYQTIERLYINLSFEVTFTQLKWYLNAFFNSSGVQVTTVNPESSLYIDFEAVQIHVIAKLIWHIKGPRAISIPHKYVTLPLPYISWGTTIPKQTTHHLKKTYSRQCVVQ